MKIRHVRSRRTSGDDCSDADEVQESGYILWEGGHESYSLSK